MSSIMVSTKNFSVGEHCSKVLFLEDVFASQTLKTDVAKSESCLLFPEKQTSLSQKSVVDFCNNQGINRLLY